jgi:hypothetical protein
VITVQFLQLLINLELFYLGSPYIIIIIIIINAFKFGLLFCLGFANLNYINVIKQKI